MKAFTILIILISLIACNTKKTTTKDIKLFYISLDRNKDVVDTFPYVKKIINSAEYILIHQEGFKYYEKYHAINLYSNRPTAPCDGEYLKYELDDLGVIFIKNTTWNSYLRLKSDNDSINELIDRAMEQIMLSKEFTNLKLDTIYIKPKTIKFIE
jgi:hypothetical protein